MQSTPRPLIYYYVKSRTTQDVVHYEPILQGFFLSLLLDALGILFPGPPPPAATYYLLRLRCVLFFLFAIHSTCIFHARSLLSLLAPKLPFSHLPPALVQRLFADLASPPCPSPAPSVSSSFVPHVKLQQPLMISDENVQKAESFAQFFMPMGLGAACKQRAKRKKIYHCKG